MPRPTPNATRYYVLEAYDVAKSASIHAEWRYATTTTFESPYEAALWIAARAAKQALEGLFFAYRIEPVE